MVAGWAFRQLLDDVSKHYPNDTEIVDQLERAELYQGLILESLDASIAERLTHAISEVTDGILNHTMQSGIEKRPYGDSATVEQYFKALKELSRMTRRRLSIT